MRLERTAQFKRDFVSLPEEIQRRIEKQLAILLQNPRHPSLRIKRMEGIRDIWEGRITKSYRFTFQMKGDTCILRRVGRHDILETP
jgi:mRNA interferase RelE/StbE